MKLREDARIKEKMEFRIDTRHVVYLIVWSIVFSGVIFYTGMVVGKKSKPTALARSTPPPVVLGAKADKAMDAQDLEARAIPFLNELSSHPEEEEMGDVVLNALAKLRLETRKKADEEEERMKKELAKKLFPPPADEEIIDRAMDPDEVLALSAGIRARNDRRVRSAKAPEMEIVPEEVPPEPEPEIAPLEAPPEPEPEIAQDVPAEPEPEPEPEKVEEARPAKEAKPRKRHDDDIKVVAERYYAVQAKSFKDKNEALIFLKYLQGELSRNKVKPYIMPVDLPKKGKWYRVRIGRFPSRLEAQKFKDFIEKKEGLQTILVVL